MHAQRLAATRQEQTSPAGRNSRTPKRKPSFDKMARQKGCGVFVHKCFAKWATRIVQRIQNGRNVQIKKPHVSDLYTKSMGGVDQADQLRSSYIVSQQSRKWYRYIFWFVFDVAACNMYILECEHRLRNHQRTRPQTDFRLELGKHLINGYTYRKRPAPSQAPQARGDHQAVRLEERKRECVLCKTTGRKTPQEYPVETKNKCQECGVALCKVQCFVEYHSTDAWTEILLTLIFT